jgi:hypothetical protein
MASEPTERRTVRPALARAIALSLATLVLGACAGTPTAPLAQPRAEMREARPAGLEIACDGTTVDPAGTTVSAERDGVHLIFTNTSNGRIALSWEYEDGSGGGDGLEPGITERVFEAAPGVLRIWCGDPYAEGDPLKIRVTDPNGFWVDPSLSCGIQGGGVIDWIEIPTYDDPLEGAEWMLSLHGSGEIVQAGYPEADDRVYILRRNGRTVASVTMHQTDSGWIEGESGVC